MSESPRMHSETSMSMSSQSDLGADAQVIDLAAVRAVLSGPVLRVVARSMNRAAERAAESCSAPIDGDELAVFIMGHAWQAGIASLPDDILARAIQAGFKPSTDGPQSREAT